MARFTFQVAHAALATTSSIRPIIMYERSQANTSITYNKRIQVMPDVYKKFMPSTSSIHNKKMVSTNGYSINSLLCPSQCSCYRPSLLDV